MGRKNRSKKGNQSSGQVSSAGGSSQPSKQDKKQVLDLVKTLLEKCSQQAASGGGKEFEDYVEIYEIVEKIRNLQQGNSPATGKRGDKFTAFMDWLKSHNVDTSNVEISNFDELGYGLKASKDLKEGEHFLSIGVEAMMTPESALKSPLGSVMRSDRILQVMPSVVLALHLLCERQAPSSHWTPYLDTLPSTYTTPLYFTPDHLTMLKGSPAFGDCINQFRNIARQYAYFYKMFQTDGSCQNLPIKEDFTYDNYRWAVSTVMTRQNQIPTADGEKMTFALIPLWDMCNHTNGFITTDFSLEKKCSECYALRNYSKGDQIFIFYGARSNAELLVNNGFVYPENEHDRMAVKLGISKSDPLYGVKAEILQKCGLVPSRTFYLHSGTLPVDSDLLVFLRVFQMEEDILRGRLSEASAADIREELGDLDRVASQESEVNIWKFLETRTSLLLRGYKTTLQEDEKLLNENKLSDMEQLFVQLRCCEKKILGSVQQFSVQRLEKLTQNQNA